MRIERQCEFQGEKDGQTMPHRTIPAHDLHIHTALSPCATNDEALSSVGVYAREAARRGLDIIAVTDHFALPAPWTPPWYENSGPDIIRRTREAARRVKNGVAILVGCEAEMVTPDRVTIDADFARSLDVVVLAASHLHFEEIGPPLGASPENVTQALLEFLRAAVNLPFVDIVAHPLVIPHEPFGDPAAYIEPITDDQFRRISADAARNGVALEINGYMAGRPNYRELMKRLFLIARGEGVRFAVGSDSHSVSHLGRLDDAESYARELGLSRDDFLDAADFLRRRQERGCAFS